MADRTSRDGSLTPDPVHTDRDAIEVVRSLRAKLARGAAQADRGEVVEPREVLKKIDALKRARAARIEGGHGPPPHHHP